MELWRTWGERLGAIAGWLWSPMTGTISLVRRARMFHPEGALYRAEVEPVRETPWPDVAKRLAGPALARLSSAWWRRGRELPDALGLALRFLARRRMQAGIAGSLPTSWRSFTSSFQETGCRCSNCLPRRGSASLRP